MRGGTAAAPDRERRGSVVMGFECMRCGKPISEGEVYWSVDVHREVAAPPLTHALGRRSAHAAAVELDVPLAVTGAVDLLADAGDPIDVWLGMTREQRDRVAATVARALEWFTAFGAVVERSRPTETSAVP